MGKVIQIRPSVKDQQQMELALEIAGRQLEFAKRKEAIYDTYLSMVSRGARKSVGREVNALRQEMFGRPRGPQPGAALRAPLQRAA
jgi:hypothetical protein